MVGACAGLCFDVAWHGSGRFGPVWVTYLQRDCDSEHFGILCLFIRRLKNRTLKIDL